MDAIMREQEALKARAAAAKAEKSALKKRAKIEATASSSPSSSSSSSLSSRLANWIVPGIVVKVVNRKLAGGVFHKKKGDVTTVTDRFVADVTMHTGGDVVRIDQDDLETVLPAVGGRVRVVNGAYRGRHGKLHAIHEAKFCASVCLDADDDGSDGGRIIDGIEYEDVCKMANK
jgi:DNA/RNA-binding protein KIN17